MNGRRLVGRILTGTGLAVAVFLIALWAHSGLLVLVVAAWSVLATLEFRRLLAVAGIELSTWLPAALNAAIVGAAWLGWLPAFILAPVGVVLLEAAIRGETRPRVPVYGVFMLLYLGLLPAHLVMLRREIDAAGLSGWLVIVPLLLTWTTDTAAWGIGRLLGRRRFAPRLSPNKTWEGFFAGLAAAGVLAALLLRLLPPFAARPWPLLFAWGVGLGLVGQYGDLFESIFKRAVGVKDSSTALGEHGGFLDRVDSLLFAIPAWYWLLRLYL